MAKDINRKAKKAYVPESAVMPEVENGTNQG